MVCHFARLWFAFLPPSGLTVRAPLVPAPLGKIGKLESWLSPPLTSEHFQLPIPPGEICGCSSDAGATVPTLVPQRFRPPTPVAVTNQPNLRLFERCWGHGSDLGAMEIQSPLPLGQKLPQIRTGENQAGATVLSTAPWRFGPAYPTWTRQEPAVDPATICHQLPLDRRGIMVSRSFNNQRKPRRCWNTPGSGQSGRS